MITAEDILKEKTSDIVCVSPDQTVAEAVQVMVTKKIGAVLVREAGKIVGIWTERDLLKGFADPDYDPRRATIGDVMTRDLHTVDITTPLIRLEEMFLGLFIRHLPVEKDGEIIAMLSIGDVVRCSLLEKDRQIRELNSMASWQYYENWGWQKG